MPQHGHPCMKIMQTSTVNLGTKINVWPPAGRTVLLDVYHIIADEYRNDNWVLLIEFSLNFIIL